MPEYVRQFSEMNLIDLDDKWEGIEKNPKQREFGNIRCYSFHDKTKWGDKVLFFDALKTLHFPESKTSTENLDFQLSLNKPSFILDERRDLIIDGKNGPCIQFGLSIYRQEKLYSVNSHVLKRNDKNKELPSKMVGLIYWKLFDYMQSLANKDGRVYLSTIERYLGMSDQEPLTEERWNEIFLPIIEEGGYGKIDSDTWVKKYKPE